MNEPPSGLPTLKDAPSLPPILARLRARNDPS
jgi:hypothetical protein